MMTLDGLLIFRNGIPPGVVVYGLVLGGLSSMTAMGLILIYRALRIVNFAQAAIGGLAGGFAILATSGWGLNYYESVLIGIIIAAITGIVVELTVVARLRNSPRLILTVATLGILQILGAAEVGLPHLASSINANVSLTTPFSFSFRINPLTFNGNYLVAMIAVPFVLFLLWLFLYQTRWGIAIRAMGDSSEKALLLGISVKRLSLLTWVVASLLSGVASVLMAPILTPSLGSATSPIDLLAPLAAATLAGFESLVASVIWSLLIGVMQQVVYWSYPKTTTVDVVLFVLILLGLLLRRTKDYRQDTSRFGGYVSIRTIHPIPEYLKDLKEVRLSKWGLSILLVLLALFIPIVMTPSQQVLLTYVVIFAIVALSLVILTSWAGQVSFGQFGFVGIGAATCATVLMRLHADVLLAIVLSAIFGAIVAVIIGIPALRLPGLTLGAATFAFAVPVSTWLLSSAQFPYINPIVVLRPKLFSHIDLYSPLAFYEFCFVIFVLALIAAYNFRKTRAGRAVVAVRDNPAGASVYGISPLKARLVAFSLSGALAGIAGALYVMALGGVGFAGLDPNESILAFTMVVVGGLGSITGAVIGAIYVEFVRYFLPNGWQLLASGAGLTLLVMVLPEGLGGLIFEIRDRLLDKLAKKRGLSEYVTKDTEYPEELLKDKAHSGALRFTALEEIESQESQVAFGAESVSQDFLKVLNVDAYYDRNKILYNVSFGVEKGEILALLGTNGSGKSTTLRVISGLLRAAKGDVLYKQTGLTNLGVTRRVKNGIVTIFGGKGVFPNLTVRENLNLALSFAEREAKLTIDKLLNQFPALKTRIDVKAGVLSGGEQQMLAIAQALLLNPELLLIDELSLGLSPKIVGQLVDSVKAFALNGAGVIVVEQSINVAASISKRAIFLERGKVRFSGPTPDLSQQPKILRSVFLKAAARAISKTETKSHALQDTDFVGRAKTQLVSQALSLINVSKYYGGIAAVDDVSLNIAPGEILGIIGPNGAGKTSLLHICSGILKHDSGRVLMAVRQKGNRVAMKNISNLSPAKRAQLGMGTMFQDAPLFSSMTVNEAIAVSLERFVEIKDPFLSLIYTPDVAKSEKAIRKRVDEVIKLLGLERFRDKYIYELSTGTRRIVEIGCIIAHDPNVVLLDEPSSGIAQRETEALSDVLLGLREHMKATFVIVEHDVPLISHLADRLICMAVGKVIASGSAYEVLNSPDVIEAYLGTDKEELLSVTS